MTEDVKDLIAEARFRAFESDQPGGDWNELLEPELFSALADALEAEVRHREEWATVGAVKWAEYYDKQIDAARDERDALRAAIQEALNWHGTQSRPEESWDTLDRILSRAIDTKEEKP